MKNKTIQTKELQKTAESLSTQFKITRAAIEEMYKDDRSLGHNTNKEGNESSTLGSLTIEGFNKSYYNINNLSVVRGYSREAYAFYPIYSSIIDSLKNMFYWRYVFYPRQVKENKNKSNYNEIYANMAEVVDGLNIETTFPHLLGKLFVDGALFLTTSKSVFKT